MCIRDSGHTNLDNVSVAGISTFGVSGISNPNGSDWATKSMINLYGSYGGGLSFNDNGNNGFQLLTTSSGVYFHIKNAAVGGTPKSSIRCVKDGAVELYHNGSKKIETTSNGVDITGMCTDDGARHDGDVYFIGATSGRNAVWDMSDNALEFADNAIAKFGSSDDLQIYHDGTNSRISNTTGYLSIQSDNFSIFNAAANENIIVANADDGVDIFFNGNKKFETTNVGAVVSGILTATSFSGDGSGLSGIVAVPSGCILLWSGAANAIPSGFVLCNGSNSTPDLRGKFVVGYHDSNGDYDVGDTGGAETVTLSEAQIPSHNHSFSSSHTHGSGSYSTNTTGSHSHTWQRQDDGCLLYTSYAADEG